MAEENNALNESVPHKQLKIDSLIQFTKESCLQNPAVKVNELKSQYKQLKRIFQTLHAKHLLLENVKDGKHEAEEDDLKKRLKECSQQNAEIKDQIEAKSTSITGLAEQAQQMREDYNKRQQEYQNMFEKTQAKRARLEEKENQLKQADVMSDEAIDEIIKSSEDKMHTVERQLQGFESLEEKWVEEIAKLTKEEKATEEMVAELEKDVERKETALLERQTNSKVVKLRETIEQLSAIQGVCVAGVKQTQIVLHIFSADSNTKDEQNLELTIDLRKDSIGELRLSDAKINVYSLNIEDLVTESVQSGCLLTLVHRIKTLWGQSYRLLSEVEQLREKYALDWLPDQGQITVLYGEVMCTLKLTHSYPSDGSISLVKVSGSHDDNMKDLDSLAPKKTNPSLTDWLDVLQKELQPDKDTQSVDP